MSSDLHQGGHEHEHGAVRKPFLTPGTLVLIATMAIGYGFGLVRLIAGIGPVTNLDDRYPWGIWIAIDVASGVALAAGGFTVAALVNIFGRKRYEALERPALLTAWLGYSFVGAGLLFDLGRYYNIWHPAIYWQGNSVLFEVGMCVMFYLTVLTVEFAPTLLAGVTQAVDRRVWWTRPLQRFSGLLLKLRLLVRRVLPIFIIAGVVLSFMHQSSLGSLMLIAPSKVSPLWWTPILPVLFLLSAIMVGFPVVIFESIAASRAFGREPEMELLAPLSRLILVTIAIYGSVKIGDVFYRNDPSVFLQNAGQTMAWMIEVGVGLVIPFILLSQRAVRESPRWLMIAISLIIGGVVLNRINVFLVAYSPPHGTSGYFPAIGEIAVTAALVATIIFLYRFFANFFPVLAGREGDPQEAEIRAQAAKKTGIGGWIARAVAVLLILGFIDIYSCVHGKANDGAEHLKVARRPAVTKPVPKAKPKKPQSKTFTAKSMPGLLWLSSPLVNKATNDYLPARFSHKSHAVHADGDCAACHHRVQRTIEVTGKDGKKKRVLDLADRIGQPTDRKKLASLQASACSACHRKANELDAPTRPGLKAAYHRQCIGCHQRSSKQAPVACAGACHKRRPPDHRKLLKLAKVGGKQPDPRVVTAECLRCHEQQGKDFLETLHWTWRGAAPNTYGLEGRKDLGKRSIVNNFCIHTAGNMSRCSQCHTGYGWTDKDFDHKNPRNIDCLVCHDTTGSYKKAKTGGGFPAKKVDLLTVAGLVGRPTRAACGSCHFYGGGGANVKHGDLEPKLAQPDAKTDVHMGRSDLRCQDCHQMRRHRIAGQALAIPASEGRVGCKSCHGERPHRFNKLLGKHLDAHSASVACQTCHIPRFATQTPTKVFWDWSKAGDKKRPKTKDALGMPTYHPKKGEFRWAKNVKPVYRWYDGRHTRHLLGDKVADEGKGPTVLNAPLGDRVDRRALIYPFKQYDAIQPIDAGTRTLVTPKLYKGFWDHMDWKRAIKDGMAADGKTFSGKVGFAKTRMYWGINHQVVPKGKALRCADCHSKKAMVCSRCHKAADHDTYHPTDDGPCRQCHEGVGPGKKWVDFKALGYKGDPAIVGGRFRTMPLPPLPKPAAKDDKKAGDKKAGDKKAGDKKAGDKKDGDKKDDVPNQYSGVHE